MKKVKCERCGGAKTIDDGCSQLHKIACPACGGPRGVDGTFLVVGYIAKTKNKLRATQLSAQELREMQETLEYLDKYPNARMHQSKTLYMSWALHAGDTVHIHENQIRELKNVYRDSPEFVAQLPGPFIVTWPCALPYRGDTPIVWLRVPGARLAEPEGVFLYRLDMDKTISLQRR